ncbi:hypothetical protein BGZ54_002725 [Gamsiella multidivaricata]|nr:hypothetical protein BGZ54_002725 [Gamsiella multidivaricata]
MSVLLSVTQDGQITFFKKGEDYRPLRSCTVSTKILQIIPVNFGAQRFEREYDGSLISWKETVCLGHEDGVIIKDEHSYTLCEIQLEIGSKLVQFQTLVDDTAPDRSELLILFEEANTRQRRVLRVKMSAGFQAEKSREILRSKIYLGRGGDARDTVAMYRDRIGIVSHRNCSSDLGHYCVLRLLDIREDVAVSTEYAQNANKGEEEEEEEEEWGDEEDEEDEEDRDDGDKVEEHEYRIRIANDRREARVQRRGRVIDLSDFAGHRTACRILAMDHARIVLGMGSRVVKILCLV